MWTQLITWLVYFCAPMFKLFNVWSNFTLTSIVFLTTLVFGHITWHTEWARKDGSLRISLQPSRIGVQPRTRHSPRWQVSVIVVIVQSSFRQTVSNELGNWDHTFRCNKCPRYGIHGNFQHADQCRIVRAVENYDVIQFPLGAVTLISDIGGLVLLE